MRLKALWRHSIGQNDIFQSIAELPLHQAAVLLQLGVQQVLNVWRCCLLHLRTHNVSLGWAWQSKAQRQFSQVHMHLQLTGLVRHALLIAVL